MTVQQNVSPPCAYGTTPSAQHRAWHQLEFYGFIHFTTNTFTDKEWGFGDEDPGIFNPTEFDARQWADVAQSAGMKGLILTCKHHDGFCLWPSAYTEHSVKNSPWRNGQGDVVRELSEACQEYGLRFGVYLSPWDRNHPEYGSAAYISYYRNQLRELLTNYGSVFEVWFDGANGGDGYYGGARETRRIDASTYYDWPTTWQLVRELQPDALRFSDAGPDIRWVGNESGVGTTTTWYTFSTHGRYPGYSPSGPDGHRDFGEGHEDGTSWVPPEVDVSIRPGWFYHASEDAKVKTPSELLRIYYQSVGRGASLLLNLPPDRRGLVHEIDISMLQGFRQAVDSIYREDLALHARISASQTRPGFGPENVIDGDPLRYWAAAEGTEQAWLELSFAKPIEFNHVILREYIALGQRIKGWRVAAKIEGSWHRICEATTIGNRRIVPMDSVTTDAVRVTITDAKAPPLVAQVSLHFAENLPYGVSPGHAGSRQ